MIALTEYLLSALLLVGTFFILIGAFGLVKLSDFQASACTNQRQHAGRGLRVAGVSGLSPVFRRGPAAARIADHRVPVHHGTDQRAFDGQGSAVADDGKPPGTTES